MEDGALMHKFRDNLALIIITLFYFCSHCFSAVNVKIFHDDGITPYSGQSIMVGTDLIVVVNSDQTQPWSGGLFLEGEKRGLASLTGRNYDPNTEDWAGSHLIAAGPGALVQSYKDSAIWGFDLFTDTSPAPTDWFVLDYKAIDVGDPNMGFYDYSVSWEVPGSYLDFKHVATRDFNMDKKVDIKDFSILQKHWLSNQCVTPQWCESTDINRDGIVNVDDLLLFETFWLFGAGGANSNQGPPDVTYSLVDNVGANEITMNVGSTVTLYVDMQTDPNVGTNSFHLDVVSNNYNLGSIDNTAIDPNSPPGPGTARILAQPRTSTFDYWGPSTISTGGLEFLAINTNLTNTMNDGNIASFEYTANQVGDVELSIISSNYFLVEKLNKIIIHQVVP